MAQPLLGRDFPGFCQLLAEAIQKKEDEEKKLAGLAEEAEDSMPIEVDRGGLLHNVAKCAAGEEGRSVGNPNQHPINTRLRMP